MTHILGDDSIIQEDKKRLKKKIRSMDEDIEACMKDIQSRYNEFGKTSDDILYQDTKEKLCILKTRWAIKNPRHSRSDGYRVIYVVIDTVIIPIFVYWKKEEIRTSDIDATIKRRAGLEL